MTRPDDAQFLAGLKPASGLCDGLGIADEHRHQQLAPGFSSCALGQWFQRVLDQHAGRQLHRRSVVLEGLDGLDANAEAGEALAVGTQAFRSPAQAAVGVQPVKRFVLFLQSGSPPKAAVSTLNPIPTGTHPSPWGVVRLHFDWRCIMNREDWRGFYRWLGTASLEELREKLQKIEALLAALKDRFVRADALKMRREIEAEILGRVRGSGD